MATSPILFIIYMYITFINTAILDCEVTNCVDTQFEFTTGSNTVQCHADAPCNKMVIYSAAPQLTIQCHDSYVCQNMEVYCGEFDPPGNNYDLSDMTKTGVKCTIDCNDEASNTCPEVSLICKGDGVDSCVLQSQLATNIVDSTLECDIPAASTCHMDCTDSGCSSSQILCHSPSECTCDPFVNGCWSDVTTVQDVTWAPTTSPSKTPTKPPSKNPTKSPTTTMPTTLIPTTNIPTTTIPTTEPTAIPTTPIPTTAIPTTLNPTTAIPTTSAPTSQPTHVPLSCPFGSTELGSRNANNDIWGCGLEELDCDSRFNQATIQDCYNYCLSISQCLAFTWAPIGGEQDHPTQNVCTTYDENTPVSNFGPNQIFCQMNTALPTTFNPTTYIPTTFNPTTYIPTENNPTTLNPTNMPTLSPSFVPETSMENKQHKNENDNKHSDGFSNLTSSDNPLVLIVIIAILILLCIFIMIMIYKIRKKKHEVFIQNTAVNSTGTETKSVEFVAVNRHVKRIDSASGNTFSDPNSVAIAMNTHIANHRVITQINDNDDNESMYRQSIHNNIMDETPKMLKKTTNTATYDNGHTFTPQIDDGINQVAIIEDDDDTEGESGNKLSDQEGDQIEDMYDSKPTKGVSKLKMTLGDDT